MGSSCLSHSGNAPPLFGEPAPGRSWSRLVALRREPRCGRALWCLRGGGIAAVSTSIAESASKRPFLKAFFNVTQRTLCLVVTIFVYRLLGRATPPRSEEH